MASRNAGGRAGPGPCTATEYTRTTAHDRRQSTAPGPEPPARGPEGFITTHTVMAGWTVPSCVPSPSAMNATALAGPTPVCALHSARAPCVIVGRQHGMRPLSLSDVAEAVEEGLILVGALLRVGHDGISVQPVVLAAVEFIGLNGPAVRVHLLRVPRDATARASQAVSNGDGSGRGWAAARRRRRGEGCARAAQAHLLA